MKKMTNNQVEAQIRASYASIFKYKDQVPVEEMIERFHIKYRNWHSKDGWSIPEWHNSIEEAVNFYVNLWNDEEQLKYKYL